MKKQILIMAMLALLPISAAHAQIGDVSGHIYSTDIAAYIDGMAIPSYNIGGKTAVIARDLEDYGFECRWDEETRTAYINVKEVPQKAPEYVPDKSIAPGDVLGDIYETDIQAVVNGMIVESYNIGGRTALVIEDMASENDEEKRISRDINPHRKMGYSISLMKATWNEEERIISLSCIRPESRIMTKYGEVIAENVSLEDYRHGAYRLFSADDEVIAQWIDMVEYDGESYLKLGDLNGESPVFEAKTNGRLEITVSDDKIEPVFYEQAITTGLCMNMLIKLSGKISINGNISKNTTTDMIFYDNDIYINEKAVNSALDKEIVSYKSALPAGCTEKTGDVVPSRVIVYINDSPINSFNTADGTCYISVKDLPKFGFGLESDGENFALSTPERIVKPEDEREYPATYSYDDFDGVHVLYPIYNSVYNVTIDGKEIDSVFVHTTLVFRAPCVSAQKLAELAGYRTDTYSDVLKVKIYTEK